ncbi:class I SAM-dependent methyltransferase [Pseudarthrobacter sp. P1]|uniref:class I SAM-dependent methyltransferase n=1 Tax=Pseudarthrobacter sp. P1 TaxID=3418418 RepID=UPI003CEC9C63
MGVEESVVKHYSSGNLEEQILAALRTGGKDPAHLHPDDLTGLDQLHTGGLEAALDIARGAGINGSSHVLDVGCGMGGPARVYAHAFGATVQGIDLTPEYVDVATSLSARVGLDHQVSFGVGNAASLPFEDASFDIATMLHVGMNIRDKDRVFAEVARVLRSGGVFAIYDIMKMGGEDPEFPLPWSSEPATSFVQPPMAYSDALGQAGLEVDSERSRREFGISFLEHGRAAGAAGPFGGNLTMQGPDGLVRFGNLLAAFNAGILAPVEIFSHKP